MSKTALAIALVLLIALAGAGIMLLTAPKTKGGDQTVQLLPTLQPERVARIEIRNEAYLQEATRWRHERTGWPVRADLVRNAIRALSGLSGPAYEGERIKAPNSVTLTMDDATEHVLRADMRGFSGMTYGFNDNGAAEFPMSVLDALGFDERDAFEPGLFPGLRLDRIATFEIGSASSSLRARRLDGRWLVELAPETWARADDASVLAALERVRQQGAERVLEARRAPDGLDARTPTLRIAIGYREGSGTFDARLYASSLEGASALVRIPGVEGAYVELGETDLVEIPTDAVAYAARTALDVVASDVRSLLITQDAGTRSLERTLDGWDGGDGASATTSREVDDLLTLLTQARAVPGRAADVVFESLVAVDLFGDDGGILHTLEAGYSDEGAFVVRVGPLAWAYQRADPPAVLRLPPYRAR